MIAIALLSHPVTTTFHTTMGFVTTVMPMLLRKVILAAAAASIAGPAACLIGAYYACLAAVWRPCCITASSNATPTQSPLLPADVRAAALVRRLRRRAERRPALLRPSRGAATARMKRSSLRRILELHHMLYQFLFLKKEL